MRDYKFDNIKCLLIILVVLGHLMELIKGTAGVYKVIYSFHMPAFVFIAGYFASFDPGKFLRRLVLPYLVFQLLYNLYASFVLGLIPWKLQFTTPYWILWYMLTMICYYLLIPLLSRTEKKGLIYTLIIASFVLGLYIGQIDKVGYYLSLSRTIVFLPFFLIGYYAKKSQIEDWFKRLIDNKAICFGILLLALMGSLLIVRLGIPARLLYGSYAYSLIDASLWMRFLNYCVALLWIIALRGLVTDQEIPVLTGIGQNTIYIFLLHGFVVKALKKYHFFRYSLPLNIVWMIFIAAIIVLVLGLPWKKLLFYKKK